MCGNPVHRHVATKKENEEILLNQKLVEKQNEVLQAQVFYSARVELGCVECSMLTIIL